MTDLDRDRLDRILPPMSGAADWDDVLDRAGAEHPSRRWTFPRWRIVAVAAVILVGGLLVTPALGLGGRLLSLIRSAPTPLDVQTPAWSPDGRKLAFVSRRDGNSEIYVINADGSGQENLTQHPARDSHPSWSPDGRKLAFVSRRDGNSDIYVMNADGSGLRNVTRAPSNDLRPAWSPNGRAIAFVRQIFQKCVPNSNGTPCNPYEPDLYVVNGDGSGLRRLTTQRAHAFNHSWSADGKTIRYAGNLVQADGSGQTELPRKRRNVVARREADRLRADKQLPRGPNRRRRRRTLGRERRRKQPSAADALRRREQSRVVPGRSPDRLPKVRPPGDGRAFRPLCRERRRERAATADTPCGERAAFFRVVTRRAHDGLPAQPGGIHRESRRKR